MTASDANFERLFDEIRAERAQTRAEFRALREEMRSGFAELRADFGALQRQVVLILTGLAIGLLGVVGALVASRL